VDTKKNNKHQVGAEEEQLIIELARI